jgi:hypothetical protein
MEPVVDLMQTIDALMDIEEPPQKMRKRCKKT